MSMMKIFPKVDLEEVTILMMKANTLKVVFINGICGLLLMEAKFGIE